MPCVVKKGRTQLSMLALTMKTFFLSSTARPTRSIISGRRRLLHSLAKSWHSRLKALVLMPPKKWVKMSCFAFQLG